MQATIGDRLHVHGKTVGQSDHVGEIIEIRGVHGTPPYLVRFGDGHIAFVFPGPDAVVEHGGRSGQAHRTGRRARSRVGW